MSHISKQIEVDCSVYLTNGCRVLYCLLVIKEGLLYMADKV